MFLASILGLRARPADLVTASFPFSRKSVHPADFPVLDALTAEQVQRAATPDGLPIEGLEEPVALRLYDGGYAVEGSYHGVQAVLQTGTMALSFKRRLSGRA